MEAELSELEEARLQLETEISTVKRQKQLAIETKTGNTGSIKTTVWVTVADSFDIAG